MFYLFYSHGRQPIPERVSGQAQEARGLTLVAVGAFERFLDQMLFELVEG
jgi:hypothetical protein